VEVGAIFSPIFRGKPYLKCWTESGRPSGWRSFGNRCLKSFNHQIEGLAFTPKRRWNWEALRALADLGVTGRKAEINIALNLAHSTFCKRSPAVFPKIGQR